MANLAVDADIRSRQHDAVIDSPAPNRRAGSDDDACPNLTFDDPLDLLAASDQETTRLEKRIERARVEPGPLVHSRQNGFATVDQHLDGVRDLVLAPPTGLQVRQHRPDLATEKVESG